MATRFGIYAGYLLPMTVEQRAKNIRAIEDMAKLGITAHHRLNVPAGQDLDWDLLGDLSDAGIEVGLHMKPDFVEHHIDSPGIRSVTLRVKQFRETFPKKDYYWHHIYGGHEVHASMPLSLRNAVIIEASYVSAKSRLYSGHAKNAAECTGFFDETFGNDEHHIHHVGINRPSTRDSDGGDTAEPFTNAAIIQGAKWAYNADCTAAELDGAYDWYCHINAPPETNTATLVRWIALCLDRGPKWDTILIRTVDAEGQTASETKPDGSKGRPLVPDAVLEAIREMTCR